MVGAFSVDGGRVQSLMKTLENNNNSNERLRKYL